MEKFSQLADENGHVLLPGLLSCYVPSNTLPRSLVFHYLQKKVPVGMLNADQVAP